jgi:Zn-dependent protease with chaperone function
MYAYTAKYYLQGGEPKEATVLLLKDKISIGIKDENDQPVVIFWFYNQLIKDNFWKRGQAIVRCGTYPVQVIEVEEKEFADKLESLLAHRNRSWLSRTMNKNMLGMVKVLLTFVAVVLAAYFWLIPFLAERIAKRVPVSYEEKLGNGLYDVLKNSFVIDEAKTFYANEFFSELNISTEYPVRITVVKEEIANAFAIPGGNIIIYDKLLAGMNNYGDLAALMSHEFIHINEKHSTRALFRQLASHIFLSVIIGDIRAIANAMIRNADNLKDLSYSRNLEKEADLNGLKILSERKIDANGFIRLFELLKVETSKAGKQPGEWISSHPDLDKRIEYIKKSELFNRGIVVQDEALKTLFMKMKTSN